MSVLQAIKTTLFGGGEKEPRIITARYNIGDKRDPGEPERRFFVCRVDAIDARQMFLVAPVIGDVGEKVIVQSDELGELAGPLVEVADRGFRLDIEATDEERSVLTRKLKWLEKHHVGAARNRRKYKRVVPREPLSTLVLADGATPTCFIIDMSPTGAAVSANIVPTIGMPLAIGKVIGRVVRHLPNGFAVKFVRKWDMQMLEQFLIKPPSRQPAAAKPKIVAQQAG
ncbi:MAG TPA: PilZ domain-containing protein [Pseudolabrys sp.]|nr:PilZ domain-containing protein [Pseudolabrys sp.]